MCRSIVCEGEVLTSDNSLNNLKIEAAKVRGRKGAREGRWIGEEGRREWETERQREEGREGERERGREGGRVGDRHAGAWVCGHEEDRERDARETDRENETDTEKEADPHTSTHTHRKTPGEREGTTGN